MTTPDEYRVIYMPFPGDIYACVRVSPDGYPPTLKATGSTPAGRTNENR